MFWFCFRFFTKYIQLKSQKNSVSRQVEVIISHTYWQNQAFLGIAHEGIRSQDEFEPKKIWKSKVDKNEYIISDQRYWLVVKVELFNTKNTFLLHKFRWMIMKMIRIMLQKQNREIWEPISCCYICTYWIIEYGRYLTTSISSNILYSGKAGNR